MSFQDNRFPILLGVVTAAVTGGLVFWSMKSGAKYETAKQDYDTAAGEIDRLTRGAIAPTPDNLLAKKKAVEAYGASVADLQKAFDPLRRPKLEVIEPSNYQGELIAARGRVVEEFKKSGTTVPDLFFLGHRKFAEMLPQKKETGVLSFELGAYEELFTKLAKAAPKSLDNLFWPGIPEAPEGAAVVAHPLELSFTGSETSLRTFLSSLDDSKDYYYVVRVMRVKNERDTAPNAKDARFEAEKPATPAGGGAADPFSGFVFPEDTDGGATPAEGDPAPADGAEAPADGEAAPAEEAPAPEPAAPADSSEILKQVLGNENLQVFLRIDVLQFLAPRELP